jgi:hypothetical protein
LWIVHALLKHQASREVLAVLTGAVAEAVVSAT